MDFLRILYPSHSASVAVFEWYLTPLRRKSFRNDWHAHCYGMRENGLADLPSCADIDHDSLLYLHYSKEANLANFDAPRTEALERMRRLIEHASEV